MDKSIRLTRDEYKMRMETLQNLCKTMSKVSDKKLFEFAADVWNNFEFDLDDIVFQNLDKNIMNFKNMLKTDSVSTQQRESLCKTLSAALLRLFNNDIITEKGHFEILPTEIAAEIVAIMIFSGNITPDALKRVNPYFSNIVDYLLSSFRYKQAVRRAANLIYSFAFWEANILTLQVHDASLGDVDETGNIFFNDEDTLIEKITFYRKSSSYASINADEQLVHSIEEDSIYDWIYAHPASNIVLTKASEESSVYGSLKKTYEEWGRELSQNAEESFLEWVTYPLIHNILEIKHAWDIQPDGTLIMNRYPLPKITTDFKQHNIICAISAGAMYHHRDRLDEIKHTFTEYFPSRFIPPDIYPRMMETKSERLRNIKYSLRKNAEQYQNGPFPIVKIHTVQGERIPKEAAAITFIYGYGKQPTSRVNYEQLIIQAISTHAPDNKPPEWAKKYYYYHQWRSDEYFEAINIITVDGLDPLHINIDEDDPLEE